MNYTYTYINAYIYVYINDQIHWILKSTKKQSQQKPTILTEAKTTFTFLKTQTFVNCF